ncbi:MAG: glycerol-3-phosphate 1-O-acyltransferase PlsY [Acidobacteria bacterium]|nr:glycerol-3-phosphate 1-O-acyltransferase PlsY [Acidobacteriota bacterium]
MVGKVLLAACVAYGLGSIPFGYLLYRLRQGKDIRSTGSGNIGATNVVRAAGWSVGAATLVLDAAKGYLAVVLASRIAGDGSAAPSVAAVFAVVGHIFPVFLGFRGGKGVATGLGAFLALTPPAVPASLAVFLIVLAGWHYVSLASLAATLAFPWTVLFLGGHSPYPRAASIVCAVLILVQHSSNIQRLWAGTEKRLTVKGRIG